MQVYNYCLSRKYQLLFLTHTICLLGSIQIALGQISNSPSNTYSPWINGTYNNLTASVTKTVASVLPLCVGGITNVYNLTDESTNNFATVSITGLGCSGTISVKDNDEADIYPAGTWAGFRIGSSGLLSVNIASEVTITTYLNGTLQDTYNGVTSLVGLNSNLLLPDGTTNLGFITTKPFNEIRITYSALVGLLFTGTVYHAVIMKFNPGPSINCGLSNPWRQPAYPVQVTNSGFTGVTLGTILNPQNIIDPNINNFATITLPLGIAATGYISVKDQVTDYTAGHFAGFEISNSALVGVLLLNNVTITTYLNGVQRQAMTLSTSLIEFPLLTGTGRRAVGFYTGLSFDEIRLTLNQPIGLNLGSTLVFAAIISNTPISPTSVSTTSPTICQGQSSSLSATCTNGTLKWYTDIGLINEVSNNVSPVISTTYYAACINGSCKSVPSQLIITVIPAPTGVTASPSSICSGQSTSLLGTCSSGILTWYSNSALTTTISSSVTPLSTTTYYGACVSGTCKTIGVSIIVNVTTTPLAPGSLTASPGAICGGESSQLSGSCSVGTLSWYTDTGLTIATTSTVNPITNTTYYAACVNGACKSGASNITLTVCLPDISPTLDINNLEFLTVGSKRDFVVNIYEINGGSAQPGSSISFKIDKLSAFDITYPFSTGTSNVFEGLINSNSDWDFTESSNTITVTAKNGSTISPNGSKKVGFQISRKTGIPKNTTQQLTVTVASQSSGEENTSNNIILTNIIAN
jgi:hypothetical protein